MTTGRTTSETLALLLYQPKTEGRYSVSSLYELFFSSFHPRRNGGKILERDGVTRHRLGVQDVAFVDVAENSDF